MLQSFFKNSTEEMKVVIIFLIILSFTTTNAGLSGIKYRRCIDMLNDGIDYSLRRFLGAYPYRRLPDADLGKVKLSNMVLSGLNTVHRLCDFKLTYVNGTVRAAGCIGADYLQIGMKAKVKVWIATVSVLPGMVIQNFRLRFGASARMAKGATAQLDQLVVEHWEPKLKFSGKMAVINWMFNLAMKTSLKNLLLDKVMKEVVIVLKDLMQKNPL